MSDAAAGHSKPVLETGSCRLGPVRRGVDQLAVALYLSTGGRRGWTVVAGWGACRDGDQACVGAGVGNPVSSFLSGPSPVPFYQGVVVEILHKEFRWGEVRCLCGHGRGGRGTRGQHTCFELGFEGVDRGDSPQGTEGFQRAPPVPRSRLSQLQEVTSRREELSSQPEGTVG